jgi:hypothetical protein
MTSSKNSPPSGSAPNLGELLLRMLRRRQQESRSSAPGNAESDPLSSSGLRSFTAASEQQRTQRQLQQESAPDNEESDIPSSSRGLRSFTAAPRAAYPRSSRTRSMDTLRSILDRAVAVLDDEDLEDSVISSRRDDSNP